MSSIEKEKGMIEEWALKADSCIEGYDVEKESYWSLYETNEDIIEYDFQTIPELKKIFENSLVGSEDVVLPLSVATFKEKHQGSVEADNHTKENNNDSDGFSIPEFIYIF